MLFILVSPCVISVCCRLLFQSERSHKRIVCYSAFPGGRIKQLSCCCDRARPQICVVAPHNAQSSLSRLQGLFLFVLKHRHILFFLVFSFAGASLLAEAVSASHRLSHSHATQFASGRDLHARAAVVGSNASSCRFFGHGDRRGQQPQCGNDGKEPKKRSIIPFLLLLLQQISFDWFCNSHKAHRLKLDSSNATRAIVSAVLDSMWGLAPIHQK